MATSKCGYGFCQHAVPCLDDHGTDSCRYVILPKDLEKGYKTAVKKGDLQFDFYV